MSHDEILAALEVLLTDLLGVEAESIDPDASLFDVGASSIVLMEALATAEKRFHVRLSARVVFNEHATLRRLAAHIATLRQQNAQPEAQASVVTLPNVRQHSFLRALHPGAATALQECAVLCVSVGLDTDRLQKAWHALCNAHALDRPYTPAHIETAQKDVDAVRMDIAQRASVLLAEDQPWELVVYVVEQRQTFMCLRASTVYADADTLHVMLTELAQRYSGTSLPRTRVDPTTAWKRHLASEAPRQEKAFWHSEVQDPARCTVPHDLPRPAVKSYAGANLAITLDDATGRAFHQLCRDRHLTPYAAFVAAVSAGLAKIHDLTRLTVGVLRRGTRWEVDGCAAYNRVNALPLTIALAPDATFYDFVGHVGERLADVGIHSDLPFEQIVDLAAPPRDPSRSPLFTVALAQSSAFPPARFDENLATWIRQGPIGARYDAMFTLYEGPSIQIGLNYATDLLSNAAAGAMLRNLAGMLEAFVRTPDARVRHETVSSSAKAPGPTRRGDKSTGTLSLAQRFEAAAHACPDRPAIVSDDGVVSYRRLQQRMAELARQLEKHQAGPGSHIAVCLPRCPDLIATVLAVNHIGATYVPLDPAYPRARRDALLHDSGAALVVVDPSTRNLVAHHATPLMCNSFCVTEAPVACAKQRTDDALSYIMYTSGSTGTPKGICVTDANVDHFLRWATTHFSATALDRVLFSTSVCFDLSVFEIFAPLTVGGSVVLANSLLEWDAQAHPATLVNTVPGLLRAFLKSRRLPDAVHTVNLAGEALDRPLVSQVFAQHPCVRNINNLYAPAETTTYSTCAGLDRDDSRPPALGDPIGDTTLYVLDTDSRPTPIGEVGEIFIGGPGVTAGYLNKPAMTAERYVVHPNTGERLYRTGDLVRTTQHGLVFVGRADNQIKLHGVRIELEEIATAMAAAGVEAQAALVKGQIVAYVAADPNKHTLQTLRHAALQRLPASSVPSRFVYVEALPRLANGKLDRARLVALDPEVPSTHTRAAPLAPMSPNQQKLHTLWQRLLGDASIDLESDFFAKGGDSLQLTQMLIDLRNMFGVRVDMGSFLQKPTLGHLDALLDRGAAPRAAADAAARFAELAADARSLYTPEKPGRPYEAHTGDIFITGATGFLGTRLVAELLERTQQNLVCLVRAKDSEAATARVRRIIAESGLADPAKLHRICAVAGDLISDNLGMSSSDYERVAEHCTEIIHGGAIVNFVYPYQALRQANVCGTSRILRLATCGATKAVHYVSTIGVWPMGGHHCFDESSSLLHGHALNLGYDETKWVSEMMLAQAKQAGVPLIIYRPGEVSGDSRRGTTALDHFAWALVKGCVQLGAAPDLNCWIDLSPVDYVAAAMVHLFANRAPEGDVFHLTNWQPRRCRPTWEWLRSQGYVFDVISPQAWYAKLSAASAFNQNALFPYAAMLDSFSPTSLELPELKSEKAQAALAGSGIVCPPVNDELLAKYLQYVQNVGFLPAPSALTEACA